MRRAISLPWIETDSRPQPITRAIRATCRQFTTRVRSFVMRGTTLNALSLAAAVVLGAWLLQRGGLDGHAAQPAAATTERAWGPPGAARRVVAAPPGAAPMEEPELAAAWEATGTHRASAPAPLLVYLIDRGSAAPVAVLQSGGADEIGTAAGVVLLVGAGDDLAAAVVQLELIEESLAMQPIARHMRVIDLRTPPAE